MAERVLNAICGLALLASLALLLIGYGERRAASHCYSLVTAPYEQR